MNNDGDKINKRSFLKDILRQFHLKRSAIFIMLLLFVLIVEGCATHYKHRKMKSIPCPCEKEQVR